MDLFPLGCGTVRGRHLHMYCTIIFTGRTWSLIDKIILITLTLDRINNIILSCASHAAHNSNNFIMTLCDSLAYYRHRVLPKGYGTGMPDFQVPKSKYH